VSAIQPAYDLDRLALTHLRAMFEPVLRRAPERVVFYIPDSVGRYSESNSIEHRVYLRDSMTLAFHLKKFPRQFPLRFDPCECPGLIAIHSITAFDPSDNTVECSRVEAGQSANSRLEYAVRDSILG
jgi:hypothetical protein